MQRYGNPVGHCIYVNFVSSDVPSMYEEAIASSEAAHWKKAMDSELKCMKKTKTW